MDTIDENENECVTSAETMHSKLLGHCQTGFLSKLGIKTSEATVKKASEKNIEKLYAEYQNRYNTQVADDLVNNLLFGYVQGMKYLFPNMDEKRLHSKLNDNIIINNEVKKQLGGFVNPTIIASGTLVASTAEEIMISKTVPEIPEIEIE